MVERYRVGMTHARLLRAESRVLAMDYGQFTLSGGSAVPLSEQRLLERAQASPPTASDGSTVLVLNPHQNNFSMEVEVELWSAPPALDSADWEQVSIERITVDEHETLRIGSPTCDDVECDVPRGEYRVEVSGRGFVNYGWPGSTHPGDRWRIRAWRDSSANHPNIRKVWEMPGFGTPWISNAVTVADESELDDDLDSSLPSTVESATRRSVARLWSDRGNRSHSKAAVEFDLEAEMKRRAAELANLALIAGEDEPLDEGDYDFGQAMEVTGPASETITVCFEESESDN